MKNVLYTVEQVAEKLDLHPKTIRRYIQEGKLTAQKIGKQWRITDLDLKDFMGAKDIEPTEANEHLNPENLINHSAAQVPSKIQVSAVVDIYVTDTREASRITSSLFAVLNCKDPAYGNSRCDHVFYQNEMKARYILWGSPRFIADILDCITAISEVKS